MTSMVKSPGGSKLAAIVQSLSSPMDGGLAASFARQFFLEADTAELEAYDASDLAALAAGAFENLHWRTPGQPKIALHCRSLNGNEFLLIDIVNDDMPFLLNSVVAAVRELGLTPELVAHPIFEVRRDHEGLLVRLQPARGFQGSVPRESVIHLQIRKTVSLPALQEVENALSGVLADVRAAVSDFKAMTARLQRAIAEFQHNPPPASAHANAEAIAFLRWLRADNFVFLGAREYDFEDRPDAAHILPKWETGLGILRDSQVSMLRANAETALPPKIRAFFLNSPPVIVAKGNDKSTVHRRVHMDIAAIKLYGAGGAITGHLRLAGLFTSSAYNHSTLNIPILRQKASKVLRSSGHPQGSHSERALLNVLETFPRDELFQISAEQFAQIADEVLKLNLTPRPRVFIRRDEFERFVSAFVYVPRERFNTDVRVAIIQMLEDAFGGRFESCAPYYSESAMVRTHIVIWRADAELANPSEAELERRVESIVHTWTDAFQERILQRYGGAGYRLAAKYLHAFPAGYQETNPPERALEDIGGLEKLGTERKTEIDIHRGDPTDPDSVWATLLQLDEPLTLSRRVPVFEAMGFHVISERTFRLTPKMAGEPRAVYLHDSDLRLSNGGSGTILARRKNLEDGFLAVWSGAAVSDRYNGLILTAGLTWRQAALLRAYGFYYRQSGARYGVIYVSEVLNKHAPIAAELFGLFDTMFNPANGLDAERREAERAKIEERIAGELDRIPVLDEDRILRNLLALINATLRTNFYHARVAGTIAFKLKSSAIDWLPAPKPYAEIFVYSPRVEGVHLRFGKVARGGIRWSDRPQDFRTEILGLVKAQQVKNAVIVPVGAKGGFVPQAPAGTASREAIAGRGHRRLQALHLDAARHHRQYRLERRRSCRPPIRCATTATIPISWSPPTRAPRPSPTSPTASPIEHGFWLGDAFASGGSAGLRPQEDGHHRARRLGIGQAPFPRDGRRHRRRRRSPWSASATCRATCSATACCVAEDHQARRRLRSPRHLHRSRSRSGDELRRAQAAVRPAAVELAGFRQGDHLQAAAVFSRAAPRRSGCPPEAQTLLGVGRTADARRS